MASLKYQAHSSLQTVTLGSGYTAASGTMALTAGHGARLPSTGDFWLAYNDGATTIRIFKVTARSTDTLTVVADATEGSGDGNLLSGVTLRWALTVAALNQLRADGGQYGIFDALPATCAVGDQYYTSDTQKTYLSTTANNWTQVNTDDVAGALSLTTAQAVPYVASSGVLAQDQYFTYTPTPGSPVGGSTFFRNDITSAASLSTADADMQADLAIRRNYSAINFTSSGFSRTLVSAYVNQELSPASDWYNTNYETNGIRSHVSVPSGVSNGITYLYNTYLKSEHNGDGESDELIGLKIRQRLIGDADVYESWGVHSYVDKYGGGDTNTITGALFQVQLQQSGGTTSNAVGIKSHIVNGSGGTVSNVKGILITKAGNDGGTSSWGISDETGWPSRLLGKVAIGEGNSGVPTSTLYVKDATASTGATSVIIDIGAGQANTATVLTVGGVLKFSGQNTTGAGSALLAANCPAATPSAPYTWLRAVSSDGSTVYIPCWK